MSACNKISTSVVLIPVLLLLSFHALLLWQVTIAEDATNQPKNLSIKLPKLFDFDKYKTAFQKFYPSFRDELVRRKLFITNTLKVFLHNLNFRLGKTSHYLSINQFTDFTAQELKKMYSGLKLKDGKSLLNSFETNFEQKPQVDMDEKNAQQQQQQQDFLPVDIDLDELQQELERIIEEKQPGYEVVAKELGVKIEEAKTRMNGADGQHKKMRGLKRPAKRTNGKKANHAEMEINEFRSIDEPEPQESSKFVQEVPSTNEQYQSKAAERNTVSDEHDDNTLPIGNVDDDKQQRQEVAGAQFIRDQLSKYLGTDNNSDINDQSGGSGADEGDDGESFFSYFDQNSMMATSDNKIIANNYGQVNQGAKLRGRVSSNDDEPGLEDKVFMDWRTSGCLTVPRDQKVCGSCYAFAAIALMEFLHCQQTSQLVPFSEQYMVDCGAKHIENMDGCDGTNDLATTARFVMDWGVELRSNYPYYARVTQCPYEQDEWEKAGYKRPVLTNFKIVSKRAFWPGVLKYSGPLYAVISTPFDFHAYGGLVHHGRNCNTESLHAMVLVGHGVEDGMEYWLYRNSYGYTWGEQGYFKLSKTAREDCFGMHINMGFNFHETAQTMEIVEGRKKKKLTPYQTYQYGKA